MWSLANRVLTARSISVPRYLDSFLPVASSTQLCPVSVPGQTHTLACCDHLSTHASRPPAPPPRPARRGGAGARAPGPRPPPRGAAPAGIKAPPPPFRGSGGAVLLA